MSGIIYQYQQAYMPANGNTFHFWVDCSKEIYEEEAAEGGTVRLLYSAPAVSLAELVPDGWKLVPVEPTEEMLAAGDQFMDGLSRLGNAYEAMLAAAPEVQ